MWGGRRCHQNITFHLILLAVVSVAFHKWRGLFTGIDDLAGACQKLLLFLKRKTRGVGDKSESGGAAGVPDGETQEFNCCLWFHNRVVSPRLRWLLVAPSTASQPASQRGAWCKSSGSPEKQVSQLFINCQVLGFTTGMWSVSKGCWEG